MKNSSQSSTRSSDDAGAEDIAVCRVLLIDDHEIWRGGVKSMLEDTDEVVGEASLGNEALTVAQQVQPQLVLLDIRMSGGDGLDALRFEKGLAANHCGHADNV